MKISGKALTAILCALPMLLSGQDFTNPVVKGIADAGAIRHAGKYYLGGVSTYGDFFVSNDLVHWDKRIHVFDLDNDWTHGTGAKNNQVHADDITYSNGLFHLLFSVNYWGDDRHIVHITHATSPSIEGPFEEVRKDQWFENRIDPQVFRDDDGRLYLYMVKFTDGNTIWARPMHADFSFAGDAVQQFSSQPGTWETMDNRVAEGPFVIKYRGRYYMMYNANHTSAVYGNYRLGVCEASSPLGFGPGGKYSHPVVSPQTDILNDNYADLLRFGHGYTPIDLQKNEIEFTLDHPIKDTPCMKLAQRGGGELRVNGKTVCKDENSEYKLVNIEKGLLHTGKNTLSFIPAKKDSRLVALGLYDMKPGLAGNLLLTPGQPNIVRGPNGWEWWLVYMANEGWKRSQFIDRIHFTNGRLTVDGISGSNTKTGHTPPALPQYAGTCLDSVPRTHAYLLELTMKSHEHAGLRIADKEIALPENLRNNNVNNWRVERNYGLLTVWIDDVLVADGLGINPDDTTLQWMNTDQTAYVEYLSWNAGFDEFGKKFSGWESLVSDDDGLLLPKTDVLKGEPAADYAFSVGFENKTIGQGYYGVYASYTDEKNYVKVGIDASGSELEIQQVHKGKKTSKRMALQTTDIHYPDVKYTDSYEKQYRFDSETFVSGLQFHRIEAEKDTYAKNLSIQDYVERAYQKDMASKFTLSWLDGDTWKPLKATEAESDNAEWQKLEFEPVKTRALRMINAVPTDHNRHIYRIKTTRDQAARLQLRVERRGEQLHVYADNRLMDSIALPSAAASRIGLFSDGNSQILVKDALYYVIKP